MRLLFLGSPEFAVPTLRALHAAGHSIEMAVTRPDRPRGRSGRPLPTAVKAAAQELGLSVYQPELASDPEAVATLRAVDAELGVVVAYGEILSSEALSTTELGFVNLHASLLPDYRGAAPINWALMRGETRTGVSVIRMAPGLDSGPILAARATDIGQSETAGELADRLAEMGAELVTEVVNRLASGEELAGRQQPSRAGFFARKLTKADGKINWSLSAQEVCDRVRGLTPWPGAYCELRTADGLQRVMLLRVSKGGAVPHEAGREPGTVLRASADGVVVQSGDGAVTIAELKPSGRRAMAVADFLRGHKVEAGDRFE